MAKSIIVIGAGIAGLSAGCYGQMNGYRTQIFELHDKPGGLCTSWKRKDYTFDGCIHWLVGSAPGNSFYRIWEELGAVQGRRMVDHEEFMRYEGTGGKTLILRLLVRAFEGPRALPGGEGPDRRDGHHTIERAVPGPQGSG